MNRLLLSVLARMHRMSTTQEFEAVHPNCWLVWEPGAWKPPTKSGATLPAYHVPDQPLRSGEALAFGLPSHAGQVTLGRATTCDIEINDATLSHLHLLFMEAKVDAWTVRDAGSTNGTWIDDQRLVRGVPHVLANLSRIHAGQVCLTFYSPGALLQRLTGMRPSYVAQAQL